MSDVKLEKFPYTRRKLEKFYENLFMNNRFQELFEECDYKNIVENCFEGVLSEEWFQEFDDKNIANYILNNAEEIVKNLPFFQMIEIFKERFFACLPHFTYSKYKIYYEEGEFSSIKNNPFVEAVEHVYFKIQKGELTGLSQEFVDTYWNKDKKYMDYYDLFSFYINDEGYFEATNWYKLVYEFTGKEACVRELNQSKTDKYHWQFAQNGKTLPDGDNIRSLFTYCIYTDNGKLRDYVKDCMFYHKNPNICNIAPNDKWTKGICLDTKWDV